MTLRERIWYSVRNSGKPLSGPDIKSAVGHPNIHGLRMTLQRLVRDGYLAADGNTHHRRYQAIGDRPPVSMIGRMPGSAIGRRKGQLSKHPNRAAYYHRLRTVGVTLEEAWGIGI
jgi:hypothetical protein